MDAVRVAILREVLAGSEWLHATRRFGGALRTSVSTHGGGLLLVGTESYEPWHLAAHLDDEAAWSGLPELSPTLVRHRVPTSAPAHLSVGLGRIEAAGHAETLLVVSGGRGPDGPLLERLDDARRAGARLLALSAGPEGAGELGGLAHDVLTADRTGHAGHAGHAGQADRTDRTDRTGQRYRADRAGRVHADDGAGVAGAQGAPDAPGAAGAAGGSEGLDLDLVQHLVSAAAGETPAGRPDPKAPRRRFRDRLSRLADQLTAPPPTRW